MRKVDGLLKGGMFLENSYDINIKILPSNYEKTIKQMLNLKGFYQYRSSLNIHQNEKAIQQTLHKSKCVSIFFP